MGLPIGISRSVNERPANVTKVNVTVQAPPVAPNPDPRNFRITRAFTAAAPALVVEVTYPGCTSYEGRKVLVYMNLSIDALMAQTVLDPHFCETGIAPFARFEPTEDGWQVACAVAIAGRAAAGHDPVAAEREACAKLVETMGAYTEWAEDAVDVAKQIRERAHTPH